MLGHLEAVEGRHRYIILIMKDKINVGDLPDDMQKYVKTRPTLMPQIWKRCGTWSWFNESYFIRCLKLPSRISMWDLEMKTQPMYRRCSAGCSPSETTKGSERFPKLRKRNLILMAERMKLKNFEVEKFFVCI